MKSLWSSRNEPHNVCIVAGLGNPGAAYEETRHNVGFQVVRLFAKRKEWRFRSEPRLYGDLAQGRIGEKKTLLLLPMTYMNSSGESVRKCASFFKVKPARILVVVDDVALPFGTVRLREGGSSGGHNGLKSVEEHLGTEGYPRLRVGIGAPRPGQDLADYVLGKFSADEKASLQAVLEKGAAVLEEYLLKEKG